MKLLFALLAIGFADPSRPGGDFTHRDISKNAFSRSGPLLSRELKEQFFVGNSFFNSAWVVAPASAQGRDGLGPTYNAVSCTACHVLDGRGVGYAGKDSRQEVNLSLLMRVSQWDPQKGWGDHPQYGDQIQPFSIPGVPAEAQPQVQFQDVPVNFADGSVITLRKPQFSFVQTLAGVWNSFTRFSPRVAPHMQGLGLIEAISESDIVTHADPEDENQDGISGRVPWVWLEGRYQLGRFGWKAQQVSLRRQNAAAFLGDIGLTTSLFPKQNCPPVQTECAQSISGGEPEVDDLVLDRVTLYTQLLGVAPRREVESESVQQGQKIFRQVGCHQCHRESYVTGRDHPVKELQGQNIYPYSDFLLHDMGDELADHRPDGLASGREWRTPPLWGVGLFPTVNKHQNLLHDARARNVEEAILWHGGEGRASQEAYRHLPYEQRQDLLKFINSL